MSFAAGWPASRVATSLSLPRRSRLRHTPRRLSRSPHHRRRRLNKDGISQRIPFRGVRRKIAEALAKSVQTAVHFTAVDEADVTQLDIKRKEYSRVIGQKLSMLPFVMLAVCKALRAFPALNANVDDANNEILIKGVINIGVAVDTESGLIEVIARNLAWLR